MSSGGLFPWQRRLRDDVVSGPNKYGVLEKSRRIGGTWVMAIAAVEYALKHNQNVWFSSSDEKNAREFIVYVQKYAEVYNAILGFGYIDPKLFTTEGVTLPNGSRVSGLSSNPRALRGKDGLIILDEVALHEDQGELLRAAQGCVIQRGKLWLLSTHNGPATVFYRMAKEAEAGKVDWTHVRVTLPEAVAEGYARKFAPDKTDAEFIESVRRSCISEDAYGQEFLCKPLSLSSLISADEYDLLALWEVPDTLDHQMKHNPLYVGIDVGRVHDLTVVWVVEEFENPKAKGEWDRYDYKTVCLLTIRNQTIPAQYERIKPILAHPSISGIVIDQGTVGRTLSDLVCDDFPFAEPITFTNPRKAQMAERVRGFVQTQRVSLPKGDPLTRTDLLSMQRQTSKNGTVTYDGGTGESHADRFWGLAMALEAATEHAGAVVVAAAA